MLVTSNFSQSFARGKRNAKYCMKLLNEKLVSNFKPLNLSAAATQFMRINLVSRFRDFSLLNITVINVLSTNCKHILKKFEKSLLYIITNRNICVICCFMTFEDNI